MMKAIYFIYVLAFISFYACDERQIELFNDGNELYFKQPYKNTPRDKADTVVVSFFYYKQNVTQLDIPLEISLSGDLLPQEKPYILLPLTGKTSLDDKNYFLEDTYSFPANKISDTAIVQIYKTEDLAQKVDTLVLTFKEDDFFRLGQKEYCERVLLVTSKAAKPAWWNDKFSDAMLGKYSEKKLRLFIDLIADDVNDILHFNKIDPALQRACCIKFKYWLEGEKQEGRMVLDEDGREMTVKVIG